MCSAVDKLKRRFVQKATAKSYKINVSITKQTLMYVKCYANRVERFKYAGRRTHLTIFGPAYTDVDLNDR